MTFSATADSTSSSAFAITPSDSTLIACRALYVGVGGDVVVVPISGGGVVTFKNVIGGSVLPIRVSKVMAATTAAHLVGLV